MRLNTFVQTATERSFDSAVRSAHSALTGEVTEYTEKWEQQGYTFECGQVAFTTVENGMGSYDVTAAVQVKSTPPAA